MTTFFKVILLAVVQGVTEFLPISSSGHLAFAGKLLALEAPGIVLEIGLHAGTMIAILVYYRKRIGDLATGLFTGRGDGRFYALAVILASIPAFLLYVICGKAMEATFDNLRWVAVLFCVTGIILLSLRYVGPRERELSSGKALWIGIAQALALLPGISRSGVTITAGRHLGLSPERAAEFSLLMSVPAIVAAVVLKIPDLIAHGPNGIPVAVLMTGMVVAGLVGYAAIGWLVRTLTAGRFWMFGIYCLVIGVAGFLYTAL